MSLADVLKAVLDGAPAHTFESEQLEFKTEAESTKRTLELLADAVVCLANARGGTVVLGVSDADTIQPLPGVRAELTVDIIRQGIFDRTRPELSVPVTEVEYAGVRLIDITVPQGATFYANAKGTSTRRIGTQCLPFSPEQQRQALASRGLYDWSSREVASATAISEDEVVRLRRLLRAAGKDELASMKTIPLLTDLRLVTQQGALTMAGLLLVGQAEEIARHVPNFGTAYQFRPSPGAEATAHFRETRPILAAVDRLLDVIEVRRTSHPLNVRGGVQLQLHDYPSGAVRELVVNALVHRDYEVEGSVDVVHSSERLRITNPGGLVYGVTPENILTHPSTPRNRLLLESVTALQVAERTGQGVDRVYREMLQIGKRPPAYDDDGRQVGVSIEGGTGNDTFTRFVNSDLDENLSGDIDVLLALDWLRTERSVSAERLAPSIQRSPVDAQSVLERLVAAGLVEPTRRTARKTFPNYTLSASALSGMGRAIGYHHRTTDVIDQKVAEHVREYGFITNQTIRRLFDLGVYQARDLLRTLQDRGVLEKIDKEARGGPGVRYGRGSDFPD